MEPSPLCHLNLPPSFKISKLYCHHHHHHHVAEQKVFIDRKLSSHSHSCLAMPFPVLSRPVSVLSAISLPWRHSCLPFTLSNFASHFGMHRMDSISSTVPPPPLPKMTIINDNNFKALSCMVPCCCCRVVLIQQ